MLNNKAIAIKTSMVLVIMVSCFSLSLVAKNNMVENVVLSPREQSIISIAAFTAKGDLIKLKTELNAGLAAGLTINQIKEILVHLYAYCGFPRSIRGLQTFMDVLDERKARGIIDKVGAEASPIKAESSKYDRGKDVLEVLLQTKQEKPTSGYGAFAPVIDTFLKEHLFADIFERDVLTYAERELVTISVLSAIGGAEPMLKSHLTIARNIGFTSAQLAEFEEFVKSLMGEKEPNDVPKALLEVTKSVEEPAFPKGDKITGNNFTGSA